MTTKTTLQVLLGLVLGFSAASQAHAGGFFFTDRGARQLGRGFAFVAGADDAASLWYNPAGLAFADHQVYVDATLTWLHADFTRVDSGGNVQPTVEGTSAPIPIPTLAYINDFGLEDFTFSLGMITPAGLILNWPESIQLDQQSQPAPQRYSLLSLRGTLFADVVLAAAWQPIPELSIGLAGHVVFGHFRGRVVTSGCDYVLCSQPENPEYDSVHELAQDMSVAFSAGLGIIYDAGPVRVGASVLLPFGLSGGADLRVQLPEAAIFDDAYVEGDRIRMSLDFPLILRAGVEVRPRPDLRAELAFVYERWSTQRTVNFEPQDVWIRNVSTLGDYQVGVIEIPRYMNDVYSVRMGGEYTILDGRLTLRSGLMYETSSFDDAYLSPLTLDTSKVVLGLGVGVRLSPAVMLDISYGHVFAFDRNVTNSRVPIPNAIRPGAAEEVAAYAGNGHYEIEADVFGFGLTWDVGVE